VVSKQAGIEAYRSPGWSSVSVVGVSRSSSSVSERRRRDVAASNYAPPAARCSLLSSLLTAGLLRRSAGLL